MAEGSYGPGHPRLAIQLNDLAGTLFMQGDYATARLLYERAMKIYEQRSGSRLRRYDRSSL